ncbi:MAG: efflux RND transporter periplasmic adaptor subunit [Elusimicrobia bacterium]|nr:efflux RND transporter periplasmic adaptor subunit [Elusimicrobiota bacterium]MDE2238109.1 efflux RND transporter periplasmic adaptor subunit [Elusimicrobiota bacterium]MDE2426804.1 efflux RND transporter periplasmic adaptor subunit [Elusimicrobiota bacterium]
MSKKLAWAIAAALIAAGAAVKLAFFQQRFLYAGTLEATKVDLSSRLNEPIAAVVPQEGDRVSKGEEVVRLLCDDVKVAAQLADVNYRRGLRLFHAGTIAPDAMDRVKNQKEESDVRLGWCSIRSPLNGTVLSRYHEPGELVGPGTKLLTLADIKDIWAYIYVPQPDVARLRAGEALTGYLPELGMRPFAGRIIKINDEAEFTPKNVQTRAERERLVFGVKVGFLGANEREILKPGMTMEIALPR